MSQTPRSQDGTDTEQTELSDWYEDDEQQRKDEQSTLGSYY